MSLDVLADVLEKSLLDRETKLAVVDIVARTPDEEFVNDLIELLGMWRAEETGGGMTVVARVEKLEALKKNQSVASSRPMPVADDAERQKKIAAIRERIKSL